MPEAGLQWEQGVGIARVADSAALAATPTHFLVCESANIVAAPKVYERRASYVADISHVVTSGFDYTIEASGVTAHPGVVGYLLWLFLGGDAYAAGAHTLTPTKQNQYLNFFVDRGAEIDSAVAGATVERVRGAKIGSLSLEFPEDDFCKWSLSGVACDKAAPLPPLTPSLPVGADNEPLAWKHLQAGDFQIGLNGGGVAQDNEIKGFKLSMERPPLLGGKNLGSTQPSWVKHGLRRLNYSFMKEFVGPNAKAQSTAFRGHGSMELQFRAVVGANYVDIAVPFATFNANPYGQVGSNDEAVTLDVQATAFRPEGGNIITATVKDGTVALYA